MRNWHVFVDESGDHCLDRVDPEFPVFVLAAVLVESEAYVGTVVPALAKLKAERDILKKAAAYFAKDVT